MRTCRATLIQKLAVATLCVAIGPAFGADPKSAIDSAHEEIRDLVGKLVVKRDPERSREYSAYRGYRCFSSMEYGKGALLEINWEKITSVVVFADFTHVYGKVFRTNLQGMKDTDSDPGFWLPDNDSAKRLGDAMRTLMTSCNPKAKSD